MTNTPLCKGYFDHIEKTWAQIEISDEYVDWINQKFNPNPQKPYPKMKELIHTWIFTHIQFSPCSTSTEENLQAILSGGLSFDDIVYLEADELTLISQGKAEFKLYSRVEDFIDPLEIPVILKVK